MHASDAVNMDSAMTIVQYRDLATVEDFLRAVLDLLGAKELQAGLLLESGQKDWYHGPRCHIQQ